MAYEQRDFGGGGGGAEHSAGFGRGRGKRKCFFLVFSGYLVLYSWESLREAFSSSIALSA